MSRPEQLHLPISPGQSDNADGHGVTESKIDEPQGDVEGKDYEGLERRLCNLRAVVDILRRRGLSAAKRPKEGP